MNPRLRHIKPFFAMEIMELAQELEAAGHSVMHLELGEPDFPCPACVQEAATRAIREGRAPYTHSLGIPALREEICRRYGERYGVQLQPDQVLVTSGTSAGLLLALSVLVAPGQEVLLSDPHYACYPNFVHEVGGVPRCLPVAARVNFQFDIDALRAHLRRDTAALLINSPANPTGCVTPPELLAQLAKLPVPLIADEIYHGLVYEGPCRSILEFTEEAFVLNGFSKLFAMPGWRLGFLIAPPRSMRDLRTLQQNLFISAGSVAQQAALAALRHAGEDVARMVRTYDERRRYLLAALPDLGFSIAGEPRGAFYVFARIDAFSQDSLAFARELLVEAGVAVAPGIDFGSCGEGHLRFSYANSLENLREAMRRLKTYLARRQPTSPGVAS
ncbi:MAG: pyridoxal phosphate-dependent aminotransferase [Candidatus Tectomicrobia bacterium]|nr:pyridoxal phosphate-dependent aminotransferase [Candidatus Tectomicrobia bacterium]